MIQIQKNISERLKLKNISQLIRNKHSTVKFEINSPTSKKKKEKILASIHDDDIIQTIITDIDKLSSSQQVSPSIVNNNLNFNLNTAHWNFFHSLQKKCSNSFQNLQVVPFSIEKEINHPINNFISPIYFSSEVNSKMISRSVNVESRFDKSQSILMPLTFNDKDVILRPIKSIKLLQNSTCCKYSNIKDILNDPGPFPKCICNTSTKEVICNQSFTSSVELCLIQNDDLIYDRIISKLLHKDSPQLLNNCNVFSKFLAGVSSKGRLDDFEKISLLSREENFTSKSTYSALKLNCHTYLKDKNSVLNEFIRQVESNIKLRLSSFVSLLESIKFDYTYEHTIKVLMLIKKFYNPSVKEIDLYLLNSFVYCAKDYLSKVNSNISLAEKMHHKSYFTKIINIFGSYFNSGIENSHPHLPIFRANEYAQAYNEPEISALEFNTYHQLLEAKDTVYYQVDSNYVVAYTLLPPDDDQHNTRFGFIYDLSMAILVNYTLFPVLLLHYNSGFLRFVPTLIHVKTPIPPDTFPSPDFTNFFPNTSDSFASISIPLEKSFHILDLKKKKVSEYLNRPAFPDSQLLQERDYSKFLKHAIEVITHFSKCVIKRNMENNISSLYKSKNPLHTLFLEEALSRRSNKYTTFNYNVEFNPQNILEGGLKSFQIRHELQNKVSISAYSDNDNNEVINDYNKKYKFKDLKYYALPSQVQIQYYNTIDFPNGLDVSAKVSVCEKDKIKCIRCDDNFSYSKNSLEFKKSLREIMINYIQSNQLSVLPYLLNLEKMLLENKSIDVVLDGPNIAYYGLNYDSGHFCIDQLSTFYNRLKQSGFDPFLILPECYDSQIVPNSIKGPEHYTIQSDESVVSIYIFSNKF